MMIDLLVRTGLTGSAAVLLWQLLHGIVRDRFDARQQYRLLKIALFFMLVPVGYLASKSGEIATVFSHAVPSAPSGAQIVPCPYPAPPPVDPMAADGASFPILFLPGEVLRALPLIWAAGAGILLLHRLWIFFRFRRTVFANSSAVLCAETAATFAACRSSMEFSGSVAVRTSPALQTPFVMGLLHPVLFLPDRGLSPDDLQYVFRHELTHIRSGDLWIRFFSMLALCLHWYNPCAHLLHRQIQLLSEQSCDAQIACTLSGQARRTYGLVLLKVISNAASPADWTAPFSTKRTIQRRLSCMLHAKKLTRCQKLLSAAMTVLMLICGTTTALAVKVPVIAGTSPGTNTIQPAPASVGETGPARPADTADGPTDTADRTPAPPTSGNGAAADPAAGPSTDKQPAAPDSENTSPTEEPPAPESAEPAAYINGLGQTVFSGLSPEQLAQRRAEAERAGILIDGAYPRNSKGETYGPKTLAPVVGREPDLVAVTATNGKAGYVRLEKFYPADIRTPEDAVAYTQRADQSRTVPVLDTEGTAIGEFIFSASPSAANDMTLQEAKQSAEEDLVREEA